MFPPPWAKTVNIISPPKTGAAGSFFSFLGGGARYATLLGTPSAVTFRVCEQRREKRRCMLLSPETQKSFLSLSLPPSSSSLFSSLLLLFCLTRRLTYVGRQCSTGIFDVVFVFFPFPIIIPLGLRSQFWHSIEASLCNQRSPTFLRKEQNTPFVQDTSGGDPLRQVRDKMEKEEESCIKKEHNY